MKVKHVDKLCPLSTCWDFCFRLYDIFTAFTIFADNMLVWPYLIKKKIVFTSTLEPSKVNQLYVHGIFLFFVFGLWWGFPLYPVILQYRTMTLQKERRDHCEKYQIRSGDSILEPKSLKISWSIGFILFGTWSRLKINSERVWLHVHRTLPYFFYFIIVLNVRYMYCPWLDF